MKDPEPLPGPPAPEEPPKLPPFPPPSETFLVLLASIVAFMLAGVLLVQLGRAALFITEMFFLVPAVLYLRTRGYGIRRCFRWNSVSPALVLTSLAVGLAVIVLLDEVDRLVNLIYPMPEEYREAIMGFMELNSWQDWLLVGSGVILAAAVFEESLFRGFVQLSFEAHGSVNRAVLISALLFALAHFNPWWTVQILLLGVFLGFLSWRSDSTLPGMFIHGLNNGLALAAGGAAVGQEWAWYTLGPHVHPAILIGAVALLFAGMKLFLRQTENTFTETLNPDESPAT
ncbi:MAG: CPBP family intramembrane metalloprotease [Candidatus Zixiibacteriota bacterium]|nr:MAG: CPBP family intramembrane metalloprotease [candidate division Zixibacteria bacterium]